MAELSRVGGPSIAKTTNNCLRKLFSKDLAKQFRLTATSGKIEFRNLRLASACRGIPIPRIFLKILTFITFCGI